MTEEELADAVALLIRDAGDPALRDVAVRRVSRAVARLEAEAFKRGYQARQDEIVANLARLRDHLRSA